MTDQTQTSRTVVRRLTAAGSSAIATIAVDGPQAAELTSTALVNSAGRPIQLDQAGARFAHWRFGDSQLADEHVVVLVRSPQAIEIHCHGGLAITGRIIEQLRTAGCDMVSSESTRPSLVMGGEPAEEPGASALRMREEPGASALRLRGEPGASALRLKGEPGASALRLRGEPGASALRLREEEDCVGDIAIQTAARHALQHAITLKESIVWLEQFQGALARDLAAVRQMIAENRRREAVELCEVLLARGKFGIKLLQPWRLTLAGPPNVGKSSLMNALCGAARVLVHHEPGTTRDAIETNLVIGDWPLVLTDTAGIREASETIERLGIETAWQRWRKADLGLLVVDATVGWTSQHDAMLSGPEVIWVVFNKIDAIADVRELESAIEAIKGSIGARAAFFVTASAKLENGVEEIVRTIGEYLDGCRPESGSGVPFTSQQIEWLEHQRSLMIATVAES